MSDIKFECQACGESIVTDDSKFEPSAETESKIYGQEFDCPHCGNKTRAWKWKTLFNKSQDSPKSESELRIGSPVTSIRRMAIREHADFLVLCSKFLIGFAILGVIITFVAASGNADTEAQAVQDWIIGGTISGSLLTLGLWLYLVGQIVHIRANTHKD